MFVLVVCVHTHAHTCICGEEFRECDASPPLVQRVVDGS